MKPRTADRFDRLDSLFPTWAAIALVCFITLALVCLFFA